MFFISWSNEANMHLHECCTKQGECRYSSDDVEFDELPASTNFVLYKKAL